MTWTGDKFLDRVWQYMDDVRPQIRTQMKLLGASADWSRFAFTMDEGPPRRCGKRSSTL